MTNYFRHFIVISFLFLLVGCSGPQVKLSMSTTANLNQNDFGEPLPVVVRLYQLSDDKVFNSADFDDLWKTDLATLGDSLLTENELVLNPGSQHRLTYARHDQAKFIAVMAIFRKPEGEKWRSIKPISTGFFSQYFSNSVDVRLKGNAVEFAN